MVTLDTFGQVYAVCASIGTAFLGLSILSGRFGHGHGHGHGSMGSHGAGHSGGVSHGAGHFGHGHAGGGGGHAGLGHGSGQAVHGVAHSGPAGHGTGHGTIGQAGSHAGAVGHGGATGHASSHSGTAGHGNASHHGSGHAHGHSANAQGAHSEGQGKAQIPLSSGPPTTQTGAFAALSGNRAVPQTQGMMKTSLRLAHLHPPSTDDEALAERIFDLINPFFVAVFLTFFGLTGLLLTLSYKSLGALTLIPAVAIGFFVNWILKAFIRWMFEKLETSSTAILSDLVGQPAAISVPITPTRLGEITYVSQSKRYNYPARAVDPSLELKNGTTVIISEMRDNIAYVEPWTDSFDPSFKKILPNQISHNPDGQIEQDGAGSKGD